MGRKHVVHQYNMFAGQATPNLSGSLTSNISNVEQLDKVSIHCSWSAGPVGEFFLQARNGATDSWFDLDMGSAMTITGADDELQILLNECPFTDIRLRYTPTSGAAVLTAYLTMKTVGA